MAGDAPDIYRTLLENLSDGVMAIDADGAVRIANPALCRMFGLELHEVLQRPFGEIFLGFEGFDEFVQIVFDAIVARGDIERRVTSVRIGSETRSLSVTTSYLAAPGKTNQVAVIVVVSDITEVRELRETELRMAKVVESQFEELQNAYRDIEARNKDLSLMMKRVQAARGVAALLVAGLFLLIGGWHLRPLDFFSAGPAPDTQFTAAVDDAGSLPTLVVEPGEFHSTVSLRGRLAPGRVVKVVSPVNSHVSAVHADQGRRVLEGAPLVDLDTGQLDVGHRRSQVEYIRARDKLVEIEDWENSAEMTRARRALRRARIALDDAASGINETAFLLEQGIIPTAEHEEAQKRHRNRQLDFEEAARELEAVREKGGDEARRVARLELENARSRVQEYEEKLTLAAIRAPIPGIVMVESSSDGKPLERGRPVSQGELLLSIADLDRISVISSIDEVDVRKITTGQQARITGPGFPDLALTGVVGHVSSRAEAGLQQRKAPKFEVIIVLDKLEEAARARLRVGMSAYAAIVVHRDPAALLVPINAVELSDGSAWLRIIDRDTGAVERRAVELGFTTLDSVEVVEGLVAGEEIMLPQG